MGTIHVLKTDPYAWDMVEWGKKTYELRYNDRNFSEDDRLILDRTVYTGAEMKAGAPLVYKDKGIECEILHVLKGPVYGLAEGWCILSIRKIYTHDFRPPWCDKSLYNRESEWVSQLEAMQRLRKEMFSQTRQGDNAEKEEQR